MLSRLEKIGLLSILDFKLQEAENDQRRHHKNSQMADQSEGYRNNEYAEFKHYGGLASGLQKAINEIKDIPTE